MTHRLRRSFGDCREDARPSCPRGDAALSSKRKLRDTENGLRSDRRLAWVVGRANPSLLVWYKRREHAPKSGDFSSGSGILARVSLAGLSSFKSLPPCHTHSRDLFRPRENTLNQV